MRKSWILGVSTFVMAAVAAAGPRSDAGIYRIELSNGSQVVSRGVPVSRGSVVTFHEAAGGALTGVPAEMVVRIVPEANARGSNAGRRAARVGSRPAAARVESRPAADITVTAPPASGLQPGDVVVIGPTGDGIAPAATAAGGAAAGSTGASGAGNGMNANGGFYGGGVSPNVVNPNLPITANGTIVGADGLPRALSSTDLGLAGTGPQVIGPNGFPVMGNGTSAGTAIGPSGTPVTPGAPQPVIGPNGTPVVAPGEPASEGQPVIGPNGTPVLAPPGQPGSTPPAIGPNGTPVLAQPGQPGSAPATTAPNGTPASPPAGGTGNASPGSPGR